MADHTFVTEGRELKVTTTQNEQRTTVEFTFNAGAPCVLHWGLRGVGKEWKRAPEHTWPAGSTSTDTQSVDTPLPEKLTLTFDAKPTMKGVTFVLHLPGTKRWLKNGNADFYVPFDGDAAALPINELLETIIDAEVRKPSWTLMHRFHLCYDLLNEANDNQDALAALFVWLRYSAMRQLDWQRNFNTKPRELSAAQDRLTRRLATLYRERPAARLWARLMLSTLGRGGEGQQVRDEILNIMHRHHIKEQHGHFMEEWHQKLHNNTTPDDVVICEAFLGFLESNGDLGKFYKILEQGGVTRERLKSFERPIKSDPTVYNGQGLVPDFKNFLRILKSVHSGTDFDSAVDAARRHFSGDLGNKINELLGMRYRNAPLNDIANTATLARELLARDCGNAKDDGVLRDLLYLDLALENFVRLAFEKQDWGKFNRDTQFWLLGIVLRNLRITVPSDELALAQKHWDALNGVASKNAEWALHARSVTDRLGRVVQEFSSTFYTIMQPKAEQLGKEFKAQEWMIPLFSEEIIRGGLMFVLALMLRRIDAELRAIAGIGGWQVVSPSAAFGKVNVVESLMAVQGKKYAEPTVLVSDHVSGNEDIPEGVSAVITTATVDLVSHAAVRARNGHVLFATCFDLAPYENLKKLNGKTLTLEVNPGGDVQYHESSGGTARIGHAEAKPDGHAIRQRNFTKWVVQSGEFTPEIVGGKSNNLNGLRGRMPDWISFPKSMALPFGVFEKLLSQPLNSEIRKQYEALQAQVPAHVPETLQRIRKLILDLRPVPEFETALRDAWAKSGLPALEWDANWAAIKRVWASKWNERAYLSRRALGISHENLTMAVLIQEVVEADYAFVIHTANPINGNRSEVFGEMVLGLGETLVGNDPGRALGFVFRKPDSSIKIVSWPGKSFGLYGKGVIFRSDSNGEDLQGFAGAGLYDSVLAHEAERRRLDYSREPLAWDAKFRDELVAKIARVGVEVEKLFDAPQDIEGAVSGGRYYVVQTRPQVGL
jgi:alpha-glucan,water dikinase